MQFVHERRVTPGEIEVRAKPDGKPMIRGYAAVFNQRSEVLFEFNGIRMVEEIAPGAFSKTLKEADVRGLWNHDPNHVLGRNKAGTLRLAEDSHGLEYEIDPPDTTWARDLMESIQRGDVTQSSFGFRAIRDRWSTEDSIGSKTQIRTLVEAELFDVSPVTFPAYPQTSTGVRDLISMLRTADQETIRSAMTYLTSLLSPAAPVRMDHPAEIEATGPTHQLSLARRKLALLERAI